MLSPLGRKKAHAEVDRKQQVISCDRSAAVSHQEACPSALCHGGTETLHPEIAVQILCSVDGAFLSPEDVIV